MFYPRYSCPRQFIFLVTASDGAVVKLENDLLVLSVAAQNGFFWQTIIDKLGEDKTRIVLKNNVTR